MRYLDDLASERQTLADTLQTLYDAAATETRELSDTEQSQALELEKRISVIDGSIETLVRTNESHEKFTDMMRRASSRTQPADPTPAETTDAAALLMRTPEFTSYAGRGQSQVFELDTRALIKTDTFADAVPAQGKTYGLADRFPLFDATNKISVSSSTVEFIVDVLAPVAGDVAEGAPKPELVYTPNKMTGTLGTQAHYAKVSRQFWEDEQGAFASMLVAKARAGVVSKIQNEIADAIIATTGTEVTHATGLLQAVRVGMAQVQENGGNASYVLLNPVDAAEFDIEVYGNTLGGPARGITPWGLPITVNSRVAAGTGYVVDSAAVDLYLRNTVQMYMTDSDVSGAGDATVSDFRSNILTLLAEARSLPVIGQPHLVLPCSKSGAAARSSK